jgi:thiol:disulfide interchange protein
LSLILSNQVSANIKLNSLKNEKSSQIITQETLDKLENFNTTKEETNWSEIGLNLNGQISNRYYLENYKPVEKHVQKSAKKKHKKKPKKKTKKKKLKKKLKKKKQQQNQLQQIFKMMVKAYKTMLKFYKFVQKVTK